MVHFCRLLEPTQIPHVSKLSEISKFSRVSACNIRWLGLRMDDISELVPEESLVPLKSRDLQIAKSLMHLEYLEVTYISCLNIILPSWVTS